MFYLLYQEQTVDFMEKKIVLDLLFWKKKKWLEVTELNLEAYVVNVFIKQTAEVSFCSSQITTVLMSVDEFYNFFDKHIVTKPYTTI